MRIRNAELLAQAIAGRVVAGDAGQEARGVSIDSRTAKAGDAFFAIIGPRHDGHDYLAEAALSGASIGIVSTEIAAPAGMTLVRVDDTSAALGRLAANERTRRDLIVVAVTGSSGKTTTRELTRAALAKRYRAQATKGNLNNQWGLPLSILALPEHTEVAVLEMGMNHAGEIRELTRLCAPDVGIITNAGRAHLGFFESIDEIADAKAEMLYEMPGGATAVLPTASPILLTHGAGCGRRVVTFGLEEQAQIRGCALEGDLVSGMSFRVEGCAISLRLGGAHAVLNALAALAAATVLGMSVPEAAGGLGELKALPGRGATQRLGGNVLLIDESYNANPSAVLAVLAALEATRWHGRRIAVLGDMLELGQATETCHEEIGTTAARSTLDGVIAVGEHAKALEKGVRRGGGQLLGRFADATEAAEALPALIRDTDLVLVKGSRGVRLERVVEALCATRGVEVSS